MYSETNVQLDPTKKCKISPLTPIGKIADFGNVMFISTASDYQHLFRLLKEPFKYSIKASKKQKLT